MSEPVAYRCPYCTAVSPTDAWEYVEEAAFCEDCSDWHSGDRCPVCHGVTESVGPPYRQPLPPARRTPGSHHIMGFDGPIQVRSIHDPD